MAFSWRSLFGRKPPPRKAEPPSRQAIRARYDSSVTTNENAPLWFMTDYLSAKAANSFQVRRTLKIRSRYEVANNSYARGIVNTIANDLVGTGPRLQVRTPDPQLNRAVEARWKAWAKAVGLADKLRLMCKAKVQDGEGFGVLVTNPQLVQVDDAVQLDVSVIESDQVTTPDPGFIDYFWVDGVVLDKLGNPTEYHILRHHPGDLFVPQLNPLVYDKRPVRNVLHWFRKDRPGQVRGIPELTPALELFAQLRRYTKAVIAAAEAAADVALFLKSEAPADRDTPEPDSENDFATFPISRGLMVQLPEGMDINQVRAEQPTSTYEMFVRLILREICRCLNVPLNVGLGDSSGYNYSSGRLDHLGYHRQQRVDRSECEDGCLDKLMAAWLDEAVMVPGYLPEGSYAELPHRWFWDSAESIDPVKDAQADQMELANQTTTLAAIYAEKGEDWEEALQQRAKEVKLMAQLGLPAPAAPATKPGVAASFFPLAGAAEQPRNPAGSPEGGQFAPKGGGGGGKLSERQAGEKKELTEKHEKEKAAVQERRDREDATVEESREKEDDALREKHDREDQELLDRHNEADTTEEEYKKDFNRQTSRQQKEIDKVDKARDREDRAREKARDKEDEALDEKHDAEHDALDQQHAAESKSVARHERRHAQAGWEPDLWVYAADQERDERGRFAPKAGGAATKTAGQGAKTADKALDRAQKKIADAQKKVGAAQAKLKEAKNGLVQAKKELADLKASRRAPSAGAKAATAKAGAKTPVDASQAIKDTQALHDRFKDPKIGRADYQAHVDKLGKELNKAQVLEVAKSVGVSNAKTKADALNKIRQAMAGRKGAWERPNA